MKMAIIKVKLQAELNLYCQCLIPVKLLKHVHTLFPEGGEICIYFGHAASLS